MLVARDVAKHSLPTNLNQNSSLKKHVGVMWLGGASNFEFSLRVTFFSSHKYAFLRPDLDVAIQTDFLMKNGRLWDYVLPFNRSFSVCFVVFAYPEQPNASGRRPCSSGRRPEKEKERSNASQARTKARKLWEKKGWDRPANPSLGSII